MSCGCDCWLTGVTGSIGTNGWLCGGVALFGCVDKFACSNALANSLTFAKRSLGSLASTLSTTCSTAGEMVGIFARNDGGGRDKCLIATSRLLPPKGKVPLTHWYTITPNAYWSLAGVGCFCICSGAM